MLQEWDKFWSMNKDEYEPSAPRFMGVATKGAVQLSLTGGDAASLTPQTLAAVSVGTVPSDPASAPRPMRIGASVFLEGEDASCCAVGDKVWYISCTLNLPPSLPCLCLTLARSLTLALLLPCSLFCQIILVMWGVVEVTAVEKGPDGSVLRMAGVRQPDASVKKLKHKFNWVADTDDVLGGTVCHT